MKIKSLIIVVSSVLFFTSCNIEGDTNNDAAVASNNKVKEFVSRYDNDVIHKVARYERGKLSGVQEVYNTKGELQNTMSYKNGVLHGESVIYFEDGSKYRITQYVDGAINGERIKYRKDGRLWSTQNYFKGMPENNLKEYAESGDLKSIPKLVSKKTYFKDGSVEIKLSVKGNYKRVKYFIGKLKEGKYFDKHFTSIVEKQERSKASIRLSRYNKSFDIIAQVTTQADNHLFIIKTFSL